MIHAYTPSSFPSITWTPPISSDTTGNGNLVSKRVRTAAKIFWLISSPSFRSPAVALTATGVQLLTLSGTVWTATSIRTSRLFAAPSASSLYELSPDPPSFFSVILNCSSSSSGVAPQLLKRYTCIREPVLPASIIMAYCIRGLSGELDFVHFIFPKAVPATAGDPPDFA